MTIVQLRDKTSDTLTLIQTAKRLQQICSIKNVPFVVNDRIDVALAAGADGVHIGQDDMREFARQVSPDLPLIRSHTAIASARELLGGQAIIGLTVSNVEEAVQACKDGADYLGIGTVFATQTSVRQG